MDARRTGKLPGRLGDPVVHVDRLTEVEDPHEDEQEDRQRERELGEGLPSAGLGPTIDDVVTLRRSGENVTALALLASAPPFRPRWPGCRSSGSRCRCW